MSDVAEVWLVHGLAAVPDYDTRMKIQAVRGCPLCGEARVDVGKLVHCSSLKCVLNRVDVPQEQWDNREHEDDLVLDNDHLRELVSRQTQTIMRLGEQIKLMQERDKRERLARRTAWLKCQVEERRSRLPY